MPANIDESRHDGEDSHSLVERLSYQKAKTIRDLLKTDDPPFILGADTVVAIGSDILGKPTSNAHAEAMLLKLIGNRHTVSTGVSILQRNGAKSYCQVITSQVEMRTASLREIREYAESGEGADKAGAYAIQGRGGTFIRRVIGSESNVIGLPIDEALALLRKAGYFKIDEL